MKTAIVGKMTQTKNRQTDKSQIDQPKDLGKPQMKWGSDVVAEVTRRLDLKYIALVPGASYRGFHDSIVNYLGNRNPQMVICLHEEHAVSIADGYGKVTEEPMAVALHSNVGLMHATMPIFNAWCDRTPMIIFGATGPVDAHRRRPWIDWIHTSKDQASMIRNYTKWDDQPASPQAAVESVLRANQITRSAPYGPVYICLDAGLQESPLTEEVSVPDPARFAPAPSPAVPHASRPQGFESDRQGKVSVDPHGARLAQAGGLGSPRALCRSDRRRRHDQQQRCGVVPDDSSIAPCRAVFASEQSCDGADRKGGLDSSVWTGWILPECFASLSARRKRRSQRTKRSSTVRSIVIAPMVGAWITKRCRRSIFPSTPSPINSLRRCSTNWMLARALKVKPRAGDEKHYSLERRARTASRQTTSGKPMTLWDMAMTVREFAKKRPITFARLPLGWPGEAYELDGPLSFMGNDGGGAVGTGPGHTIGAALALKGSDRLTIGVIGDGDYLMGVNALWTAAHFEIPVMIVVADNRSYFNDEMHQERVAQMRSRPAQNRWIGQRIDDPRVDLVAMARAQGFDSEAPVSTTEALAKALKRGAEIVAKGGRYFIDSVIEPGYADSGPDQRAGNKKKS